MNILDFECNTEYGFAHILVSGKKEGDEWVVQCCLKDRSEEAAEAGKDFDSFIIMNDCGHNDGICGDANETAFEYWGEDRCMTALFQAAKNAGVEVVE